MSAAASLTVVTDEASDSQDRFVFRILLVLPVTSDTQDQMDVVTVDFVYLSHVNATTVSQAIIQCLTK